VILRVAAEGFGSRLVEAQRRRRHR
jgi:hypothetical protein